MSSSTSVSQHLAFVFGVLGTTGQSICGLLPEFTNTTCDSNEPPSAFDGLPPLLRINIFNVALFVFFPIILFPCVPLCFVKPVNREPFMRPLVAKIVLCLGIVGGALRTRRLFVSPCVELTPIFVVHLLSLTMEMTMYSVFFVSKFCWVTNSLAEGDLATISLLRDRHTRSWPTADVFPDTPPAGVLPVFEES